MTNRTPITRSERLALAGAVIRGTLAGVARATIAWMLTHFDT